MKKNLHDLCVVAVNQMVKDDVKKHISYIRPDDNLGFGLKEGGKIPKVTIEWVDENESDFGKISQIETV